MEIPNLSLNSTFSVPHFEHHQYPERVEEALPSPTMCHYIWNTKECGHRVKDHVEPQNCPYFQRTGVHCDRDNGDHRDRWTYEDKLQYGICNNCLCDARKDEEAAMKREQEKMRQQDLEEARRQEDQLRRAQEELRERNRRENEEAKEQKRRAAEKEDDERQKERDQLRRAQDELRERNRREDEEAKEQKRRAAEREEDEQQKERARKRAAFKAREEARAQEMEQIRLEAEAREQEEIEKVMRQSQAEHEARLAADLREAERQSKAEVDRQAKLKEEEDYKFMLAKSLAEEEARRQKEADDMARALRDSAQYKGPHRNYKDEVYDLGNGQTLEAKWTRTDNYTVTQTPRSPSPPAPAPKLHTPPPTPPAPAPKPKTTTTRPPPPPKPAPKPTQTDYTLPAVGNQEYDRFRVGNRSMPVHESQKMPETPTSSASPLSPIGSMPISRLGGAIAAADMPIVREAKPSIPGPAAFAGLKKTAGPRKGPPPPVPNKNGIISGQDMDPKLAAMLSKRRAWEPAEEESAPSPPVRTASAEARRLAKEDFDKGRKTGWKKDDE